MKTQTKLSGGGAVYLREDTSPPSRRTCVALLAAPAPAGSARYRTAWRAFVRGFGLVEVMVVIAIVGVLSGIAVPALSGIFRRAESASALRNAQYIVSYFDAARSIPLCAAGD